MTIDISNLLSAYSGDTPDPSNPAERVSFGTSGHRGSSLRRSFNEHHILAIVQAVVDWRRQQGLTAPCIWARTPMPCPVWQ